MSDRDAIGFALTIAGTFLAALGYVLQKAAHVENSRAAVQQASWKNWKWSLGLVSMVASATLVVLASPFLDQSKSAPLGAATLVFNMMLATLVLKERFAVIAAISTTVIVIGTIVAVSSSDEASKDLTFSDILELLKGDGLVTAYSIIMAVAMPLAAAWIERLTRRNDKIWSPRERAILSVLAPGLGGWCNGYTSYAAKVVTTVVVKGELGGALSGSSGGGAFWVYLILVVAAVVGQVRYLNKGLAYFSAISTVPVFQASIIISNSLAGIVYFRDLRGPGAESWRLAVFFIGAAVCVGGIILLRLQRPTEEAAEANGKPTEDWGNTATIKMSPLVTGQAAAGQDPGSLQLAMSSEEAGDGATAGGIEGALSPNSTRKARAEALAARNPDMAAPLKLAAGHAGPGVDESQLPASASGTRQAGLNDVPVTLADWLNLEVGVASKLLLKQYRR